MSIDDDVFGVHHTERKDENALNLQIQASQLLRRREAEFRDPLRRRINIPGQGGGMKQFLKERTRRETESDAELG